MFTYARTFWFSTSSVALLVASVALSSGAQGQTQVSNRQTSRGKQPITVVDAVGITRLEAPDPFAGSSSIAHFSPDGKRFAVVVRKGNLEKNANEFSLRLYNSAEVFHSRTPDIMVEMSSTSNRPAITKVRWLADNETLVFLGEKPDELSQVYSFNVITQRLAKLTHHSTAVSNYDVTQDGHIIAFEAAPLDRGASRRAENGKEVVVTNQEFADLMTGEQSQPVELFWQVTGQ